MNQFVNQLMLGQPLYGSTGPPDFDPLWMPVTTWIFAAQYLWVARARTGARARASAVSTRCPLTSAARGCPLVPSSSRSMEIYDNNTAKAAAGPWYNCTEGEVLWTEYSLDDNWSWTLSMGVVGDPTRTSSFVADKPFMGLLESNGTSSWAEPAYEYAFYNGCCEARFNAQLPPRSPQGASRPALPSIALRTRVPPTTYSTRLPPPRLRHLARAISSRAAASQGSSTGLRRTAIRTTRAAAPSTICAPWPGPSRRPSTGSCLGATWSGPRAPATRMAPSRRFTTRRSRT